MELQKQIFEFNFEGVQAQIEPLFVNFIVQMWYNGMLRHAFDRLEGGKILWHIVAPPPPSQPSFSLSFLLFHLI